MKKNIKILNLFLLFLIYVFLNLNVYSVTSRLKDLVDIQGARGNQLYGYGLVVGLNGTGDKTQTVFTAQSLTNMLDKLGIVPSKISKFGLQTSGSEMKVKNVAAVFVTAELNPFIRSGAKIDVTVSSIGDCSSLEGGTLVMTPLQGADSQIYAVAQGPVSVGGLKESVSVPTHPTVAHIPMGAYVEREVPVTFLNKDRIILSLKSPDFTTSNRICESINQKFNSIAHPIDSGSIEVKISEDNKKDIISFIAKIEQLKAEIDIPAKIVINERTGTIVTGENVKISAVAVSHGTLTVSIKTTLETAADTSSYDKKESKVMLLKESITIGQVAETLSALGATPTDMIAIFQAIFKAGAMQAKLEIM